jgi:uncharacterized protein DUF4019
MKAFLIVLFASTLLAGCNVAIAAEEPGDTSAAIDTTPAMEEAREWLLAMDAGRYGDAWESASEPFRASIERGRWEITAQQARNAVGLVIARKLRTASYTRQVPGAPIGEYVAIVYDSRFERRPVAVELLTAERGKDGRWRIAGYSIR